MLQKIRAERKDTEEIPAARPGKQKSGGGAGRAVLSAAEKREAAQAAQLEKMRLSNQLFREETPDW